MIRIAFDPIYEHPLPDNHRFPMEKYGLLHQQILHEGIVEKDQIKSPRKATIHEIKLVHNLNYIERLERLDLTRHEIRKTGFPLSRELVQREVTIMGGSIEVAEYALYNGAGLNIAGGTHHAFSNRGEGFCLLNDLAIAVESLRKGGKIKKALIVDLDVHQGNGTAEIFRNTPDVFTFSMHGAKNYPMHKETSDLDIGLDDNTSDSTYLNILEAQIPKLIDLVKPDLIAYQSGVDVLAQDKLGRLGLSLEACKERDILVFSAAAQHEIPIFAAMGGGYSPKISDIVNAHANTFRVAAHFF